MDTNKITFTEEEIIMIEGRVDELMIMIYSWLVWILIFLLIAWWLYLINKKLWEKYAWLSFFPIIQIYNYITASKKSFFLYFILPFITCGLWVYFAIKSFNPLFLVTFIHFDIMWMLLMHSISKRCGRWVWTTIGFLLIPFIMLPVVWLKLKYKWDNNISL